MMAAETFSFFKIADAISTFVTKYADAESQHLFKNAFKMIRHYKEREVPNTNLFGGQRSSLMDEKQRNFWLYGWLFPRATKC